MTGPCRMYLAQTSTARRTEGLSGTKLNHTVNFRNDVSISAVGLLFCLVFFNIWENIPFGFQGWQTYYHVILLPDGSTSTAYLARREKYLDLTRAQRLYYRVAWTSGPAVFSHCKAGCQLVIHAHSWVWWQFHWAQHWDSVLFLTGSSLLPNIFHSYKHYVLSEHHPNSGLDQDLWRISYLGFLTGWSELSRLHSDKRKI